MATAAARTAEGLFTGWRAVPPAAAAEALGACRQPLRVATFNILADGYALGGFHSHCPREWLEWGYRRPRLLAQIQAFDADVLCLQEVERPFFEAELQPLMAQAGYQSWLYPRRRPRVAAALVGAGAVAPEEGVALLVRTARLRPLAAETVRLADGLPASRQGARRGGAGRAGRRRGRCPARRGGVRGAPGRADHRPRPATPSRREVADSPFWQLVASKEDGAVVALLEEPDSGRRIVAAATHLHWDPRHPDVKASGRCGRSVAAECSWGLPVRPPRRLPATTPPVAPPACRLARRGPHPPQLAQAHLLCAAVARFASRAALGGGPGPAAALAARVPLILAGDFNSLPIKTQSDQFDTVPEGGALVSGVYTLLSTGEVPAQHPDHPARRRPNGGPAAARFAPSTSGLRLASASVAAWGAEPPATNCTASFRGTLDYVWLSEGHWEVVEALELPGVRAGSSSAGDDIGGCAGGAGEGMSSAGSSESSGGVPRLRPVPDAEYSSDHLPLAFSLRLPPEEG
eukprot:scaffold2.g6946.t1